MTSKGLAGARRYIALSIKWEENQSRLSRGYTFSLPTTTTTHSHLIFTVCSWSVVGKLALSLATSLSPPLPVHHHHLTSSTPTPTSSSSSTRTTRNDGRLEIHKRVLSSVRAWWCCFSSSPTCIDGSWFSGIQGMNLELVIVFFFLFFSPSASSDLDALLEFKKGIQWDPSGALATWVSPNPADSACPSSFHGVSCEGSAVVSISLSDLGLSGELKLSTLTSMASLRNLSLSNNNFSGRLVPSLGSMTSLQWLDLSINQFYGPVPARITELWGLTYLNLSGNSLSGGVPSGFWNLQQLRTLDFRSNGLWGDAASLLSELRNVEHLDVSDNGLSGGMDMDPGNLSSLANTIRYLNFSSNKLNGGFFSEGALSLFRSLEVLDCGWNQIGGELPSFGSLANLKVLRIGHNQLYGPLPPELFWDRMQLEELDLSGNGFSGSLSSMNSTTLKKLNLSSNELVGSLPSSIGSCQSVDLSKNMLSGNLQLMQDWQGTLEVVDLTSNNLSGNFPENATQFGSLVYVKISNNSLSGPLPSILGSYPGLATVDLSSNNLIGPILQTLLTSSSIEYLNLSGNQFTGSILFGSSHSTESLDLPLERVLMEILDLSYNQLSGGLSSGISNLQQLISLHLETNSLSGELPMELGKLEKLEVLDLSGNRFTGRIPDMSQQSLVLFNVSYNDLSGAVPQSLDRFPPTSFHPGNSFLFVPDVIIGGRKGKGTVGDYAKSGHLGIRVAFAIGSVGVFVLILAFLIAFYKMKTQDLFGMHRFGCQAFGRDVKLGKVGCPAMLSSQKNEPMQLSTSTSNAHLLTSASMPMFLQKDSENEIVEFGYSNNVKDAPELASPDPREHCSPNTRQRPLPWSPSLYSPRIGPQMPEQPVVLDVYSPDRLVGELFIMDESLVFSAEELSRAPAEVLGRSSHGTSYKARLDSGRLLTVKWLRVGLVKHKKAFVKEARRICGIKHPKIISLKGYYWGPKEQERLIVTEHVNGDSLALHLYEYTPRRYSRLSVSQRLRISIDIARCLYYLHHDRGLPHGNLKPSNIILGPDFTAWLTDCALHRLLTASGSAEQILNLGALGYRAPELAAASKPLPSFKADVYSFGVILMEMLTRRSAGDIISGHTGAVDLTDWVRMCSREGRGPDCFDREIAGLVEAPSAMEGMLAVSLKCILPVTERPSIEAVLEDLCSITL